LVALLSGQVSEVAHSSVNTISSPEPVSVGLATKTTECLCLLFSGQRLIHAELYCERKANSVRNLHEENQTLGEWDRDVARQLVTPTRSIAAKATESQHYFTGNCSSHDPDVVVISAVTGWQDVRHVVPHPLSVPHLSPRYPNHTNMLHPLCQMAHILPL
jgi:hypothetical protein